MEGLVDVHGDVERGVLVSFAYLRWYRLVSQALV